MGCINLKVSTVVAVYDAFTDFPVQTTQIKITTDQGYIPLYKGMGVFVFMGEIKYPFYIRVEAEGYQTYYEQILADSCDKKNMNRHVIWLIPDCVVQKDKQLSKIHISLPDNMQDCLVFVTIKDEILRFGKKYLRGEKEISLFRKTDQYCEGRQVLFLNPKECEVRKFTTQREDELLDIYELDEPIKQDMDEEGLIYKGFFLHSYSDGNVHISIPSMVVKEDVKVFTTDGKLVKAQNIIINQ